MSRGPGGSEDTQTHAPNLRTPQRKLLTCSAVPLARPLGWSLREQGLLASFPGQPSSAQPPGTRVQPALGPLGGWKCPPDTEPCQGEDTPPNLESEAGSEQVPMGHVHTES